MADENIQPGGGTQQPTEGAGSGQQPTTDPQGGNNGQPSDKKPDEGGQQQQPPANGQDPKAPNDEPQVRKTKKDFIIDRMKAQRDKARQNAANPDGGKKPSDDGGAGASDDDIDPEDEARITKVLDKRLGPVMDELDAERQEAAEKQEEADMQTFLTERPEFKPYEARIRKFAQHDSRKHLPLLTIAYEVAGPDLEKIGAEKERKAAKEAAESTAGGGSTRTDPAMKPISEMTTAEFREVDRKIRSGEIKLK